MNETRIMTIGEVCATVSDTYRAKADEVTLINTSDVLEGKVLNHERVPNKELKGQFKKTFKKDDILYSEIRPQNKRFAFVDFNPVDYIASTKLMVLRADTSKVLPMYLYYHLKSAPVITELQMLAETRSGTFPQITFTELSNLTIPVPSITEQEVIVATIKCIEDKIDCNAKINDNLLEQIQALYKAWFVDHLPFGGVKPESWTQTDIYSLANIIYGAPFVSKQFNTEGNGKPIVRIRDLKDQQFATYTTEVHPKGYLLQPGDVVVGMDGEFRPYIWGNDEAWLNQRVCVFENKRPNGKAFLYFTIKPLLFAIEQTQVATTVIHIGKKDYDAFEITLPDSSTLDSFDALTSPMIMRIVSNSFENKRLAAMRDTLLPKLMSGEIDVSNIEI